MEHAPEYEILKYLDSKFEIFNIWEDDLIKNLQIPEYEIRQVLASLKKQNYVSNKNESDRPKGLTITKDGQLRLRRLQTELDEKSQPPHPHIQITENYGPVSGTGNATQGLSDNARINPITQTIRKRIDSAPKKRSWLEVISWIAGISAALICIYEFILKK